MLEQNLAKFITKFSIKNVTEEVIHSAKRSLLDWFSAVIPGGLEKPARLLTKSLGEEIHIGSSRLIPFGTNVPPRTAALVNGTAAHTLEVDDIYREGIYHPGPPVIAAAFSIAQSLKLNGDQLMSSIIVGYEVSNRVAAVMQPYHYDFWHTTGTVGAIGAASGASKALNLTCSKTLHALANATTFAAGLQQAFRSEAMSKALHAGRAAETGVLCALMAEAGVTGAKSMITGARGFGNAMSKNVDWGGALKNIEKEFTITKMTQKNHFCCGHNFAAIDGVIAIIREYCLKPEKIKRICVKTYKKALEVCGNYNPKSAYEAKFSLPYTIAVACYIGNVRSLAFTRKWRTDPRVLKLLSRVELTVDDKIETQFPQQRAALIEIHDEESRVYSRYVPTRRGDPDDPLSDDELEEKYLNLVVPIIGRNNANDLKRKVWALNSIDDINEICTFDGQ